MQVSERRYLYCDMLTPSMETDFEQVLREADAAVLMAMKASIAPPTLACCAAICLSLKRGASLGVAHIHTALKPRFGRAFFSRRVRAKAEPAPRGLSWPRPG